MTDPNPTHTPRPAHWLEALLLPHFGWGNVDAVHTLLSTGMATVPEEYPASPRPLFEALLRGNNETWCWEFLSYTSVNEKWPISRKGGPLPLTPEDTFPDTPALPDPAGVIPNGAKLSDYLQTHEAVFARLLAAGANPWLQVQLPKGPMDGFDLACAWCCTPLIEACLRHPDRPDLETLYSRSPWRSKAPPIWKDKDEDPFFSPNDTLVHAFAVNGDIDSVRLLLTHGWKAHPETSTRAPIEVAASAQVVEALLEAGATWKERYADSWEALATHHTALCRTLIERHNKVVPEEDPQVAAERMAQLAIKAFRERNFQNRQKALEFFTKTARGQAKTFPEPNAGVEVLETWLSMPEVSGAGKGKKVAPLYHICRRGIMDQTGAGELLHYVAYLLARGTQTLPTAKVTEGCTVRGMAHLFLSRSLQRLHKQGTSKDLASILAEHETQGVDGALVRDILQGVKSMTLGTSSNTAKKIRKDAESYLSERLPFPSSDARFQALTDNLDYFRRQGILNVATLPSEDWLLQQPLQVWVGWGTALAAGGHLKTLRRHMDCICARLEQIPHDENLEQALRELEERLLTRPQEKGGEGALAARISEARMQWNLPQAPRTTPKTGRF